MPEQYLQDFATASDVAATDLFRIQRVVNGTWQDFKITFEDLYGVALQQTFVNTTLAGIASGVTLFSAGGAGTYTIPVAIFINYKPGGSIDGQNVTFQVGDNTTNDCFEQEMTLGAESKIAVMRLLNPAVWQANDDVLLTTGGYTPSGSGTIRIHTIYTTITP